MSTPHLALTAQALRPLREAMEKLCRESEASSAALLQDCGQALMETGEARPDAGENGALAVGAFFAARQLALRLGETDFAGLHYEGKSRHFFVTPVDAAHFLLLVFDHRSSLAVVRACARRALPELASTVAYLLNQSANIVPFTLPPEAPSALFSEQPRGAGLAPHGTGF